MTASPRTPSTRNAAFTLIELLIVIAVIAVIAGILLAVFGGVQRRVKTVQCVSNLRQIASGMQMYQQDHRMHFPGHGAASNQRWIHQVGPYMGEKANDVQQGTQTYRQAYRMPIFHCPLTKIDDYQGTAINGTGDGLYGMNAAFFVDDNMESAYSTTTISRPSATILVGEKSCYSAQGIGASGPSITTVNPFPPDSIGVAANHREGGPAKGPDGAANYLFCDGHVETLTKWPGTDAFKLKRD